MKFVHTFCSTPLLKGKFNRYIIQLPIIITDYTYSATCLKKLGQTIELYADQTGADILSHIPYDKVHIIEHNDNAHFAASIKFKALEDMQLGDVLIDGDLFIQQNESIDLIKEYNKQYDFVYSFFEPVEYTVKDQQSVNVYNKLLSKMNIANDKFIEPYTQPEMYEDLTWPNTSLMVFNNQHLKDEYIRQYYYHKDALENIDFGTSWPDIIIEQYHMKKLLNHYGFSSKAMIENFPTSTANNYALDIGYTHLGNGKETLNNMFMCELYDLDQDMFYKMIDAIHYYLKNKPK